eukprot:g20522.t1
MLPAPQANPFQRVPLPWSTGQAEVSEKVVDMAANTVNDSFGKNADYNSQPGNDLKQKGQAEGSNSDNKQETIMLQVAHDSPWSRGRQL